MIKVLADSSHDATLIARAVHRDVRVMKDEGQFANGDAHVECLILGCRSPIPPGRLKLLREVERNALWVPFILVTDRDPEVARRLSDVRVSGIVWFADLSAELQSRIEAVRQSVPLLHVAEQLEGSALRPALRCALAHSLRAATERPVRNVEELAAAVRYSPITLSKAFSGWQGGDNDPEPIPGRSRDSESQRASFLGS